MTAAQAMEHEGEKHTGIKKVKIEKERSKAQM